MPDPETDDDMLENNHAVGLQRNEDIKHSQELDIARDMNEAENKIRES